MIQTRHANLQKSLLVGELTPGLELWRIGEDRLPEYTALSSRIYHELYDDNWERKLQPETVVDVYREFSPRAVFMAVIKNDEIVVNGLALLAYRPGLPVMLPEDVATVFDPAALADEFQAPEVWYMSRMAIDKNAVGPGEGHRILRAVSSITADVVSHDPDNILITVLDTRLFRMYRRYGVHWNILDGIEMSTGGKAPMQGVYTRAGDLR